MGWQPESATFRCHPRLLPYLREAARSLRHECCRADMLWAKMLTQMCSGSSGRCNEPAALLSAQQREHRMSLTALLQSFPEALPTWFLFSFELEQRLSALIEEASAGNATPGGDS